MKKVIVVNATIFLAIFLFANVSFASLLPQVNDVVKLDYGTYYEAPGGEFELWNTDTNSSYSYITFCLERHETFSPNTGYKIHSIEDFALSNSDAYINSYGGQLDYVSTATKWLMNEYINNYNSLYTTYGESKSQSQFAGDVQDAIWYFEDEITTSTLAQQILGINGLTKDYQQGFMDWVKVINIWDGANHKQSQIFVGSVPEPATMLLLGTGLLGLVGLSRRKFKK